MTNCPCCGYSLVQCFRHHQTVSFCRHCWQEMPDLVTLHDYSVLKGRSLEQMMQKQTKQPVLKQSLSTAA
ncbi:MAG: hypothetical protein NW224_02100 [Leptolyngbyaceae cyanobacterium bins.302]|nr:hypothetical protein [Leptolyngbyaceae cyanobacterium bins.302]